MLRVLRVVLFSVLFAVLFSALTFAVGIKSSLEVGGDMYIKGNLYLKSDKTTPETSIIQIARGNNKPAIRWTPLGWQYTNNGTVWNDFGTGGSGGVVTSIEISRDNTNWYNVGLTQGQFTLNKNDYIRVSYTTAPNMYLMEH
jgi:hypothetical protein